MEEWISVKDAAKIRKCSERNIIELIKKGALEAKKDGRKWLVLMDTSQSPSEPISEIHPQISEIISVLKTQLQEKDEQIKKLQEQLSDTSQRHDTIVMQLTRQLEQSQRLLEYHQEPWYRRWFRKRQSPETR